MASTQPGQSYTPTLYVLDANGSPVLSGVSGTMDITGPSTSTIAVSSAISSQGYGHWGFTVDGSYLTARGTYKFNVATLTVGGNTYSNQGGTFDVQPSDGWTMREVYTSVRLGIGDGKLGISTSGTTALNTFSDSRYAYGANDHWNGSELLFLEPITLTDTNPVVVTAFSSTSGTFTIAPAVATSAQLAAGQEYILGRLYGQGWDHDQVWDAIKTAVRRARQPLPVQDSISVVSASTTWEYSLPATWVGLDRVEYNPTGGDADQWVKLPGTYWRYLTVTGKLSMQVTPPSGNAFRLTGRALPAMPTRLGEVLGVDGSSVRDDAIYELLLVSTRPEDRQRAQMMQQMVRAARVGSQLARL